MTLKLENNRPVLSANQIAGRVRLSELKGWFSKDLTVSEGTCALIYDGGRSNGTVPPGTYSLQTFLGSLFSDMDKRNISAVICRTSDIPLRFTCGNILTREKLLANIELNITIHFTDLPLFTLNLLGQEDEMSFEKLTGVLQNILLQSIRESVAQMSITEITLPQNRNLVLAGLQQTAKASLARYGFDIVGITFLSISNEQYNELQQKVGEIFLLKEGVEIEAERAKVEELRKKYEIEASERENNLLVLTAQVEDDKKDAELLRLERNIRQGQKERELIRGDKFNDLQNEAEITAFLQEQEKAGLLRKDELRQYEESIKNGGEDRELARKHLLDKVNSQNAADLEKLQAEIKHAQKQRALDYEVELSAKQFDEHVKQLQRDTEAAKLTFTKTGEEYKIETLNVEHKIALQRLQDKYDDERYDIKKRRERDDLQFDDDRRKRELEWKQKLAADNIKMMAELDAQRRKQKHDAELALKTLDNDSEKAKLLAEKAAAEKLEQERTAMNAQLSAAQEKHAAAFAKSADDIKEIALVLAGAKSGGQTAEQPKEKVILVCPKCKTRNGGDSKFCGGCGEML